MTTNEESPIIRTSGARFGKGLAIIVILMAIGAGMHLAFSDMWNKYPPANQLLGLEEKPEVTVVPTGERREFTLTFTESEDLRTLGFNGITGEEGANPDIVVNVGDTVAITTINDGKMPHAFGVVTDPDDPNSIVFGAKIKSASEPMLRGNEGAVEFTPTESGEYYYICTVPGHPALGMKGKFIVEEAGGAPTGAAAPVEPTGASVSFDLAFTESADLRVLGFNAPEGEPDANPEIRVNAGDEVTVNVANDGKMPHAFGVVTDPDDPNSIVFGAKIKSANNPMLKGQTGSVTFIVDTPGRYFYICTVPGHPLQGMQGSFIVE